MKRFIWISIGLVLAYSSIAFVFAGPQVQEKTDKKEEMKVSRSCEEDLIGLEALAALDALKDFKIDLSGLERLKDLEVHLEGLEALKDLDLEMNLEGLLALEALEDMEMDLNLEGLAIALDSLKMLEHMDLHFDLDDLNFGWDDFDFDFDLEWLKEFDWGWDADEEDEKEERSDASAGKKIKKTEK
jgi:hypothetical protein